jgi:hypothetical protein
MISLEPRSHVVRSGETLSSIAAKYGFPDWKAVYYAPCNADLRKHRPGPDKILSGDRVFIPPKPEDVRLVLRERLSNLQRLRFDTDATFQRIEGELDKNYRDFTTKAMAIDYTGAILIGLTSLVSKGMQAMKLSGAALEKANKEMAKAGLVFAYKPIYDLALKDKIGKVGANEGTAWAIGKGIEILADITTPSFWAGVYANYKDGKPLKEVVTRKPEDSLLDVKRQIENQRKETLQKLDEKIRETQRLLQENAMGPLDYAPTKGPSYA